MSEKMITVETLAEQFNVSPRTIVRLIERRQIRALKVGRQWRFRREWIDEWISQNTSELKESVG